MTEDSKDCFCIYLNKNLLIGPAISMFRKKAAQKFLDHLTKVSDAIVLMLSPPSKPPTNVIIKDIIVTIKKQLNKILAFKLSFSEENFFSNIKFTFPTIKLSIANTTTKVSGNDKEK